MVQTSYAASATSQTGSYNDSVSPQQMADHGVLKRQYLDYLGVKQDEIREQQNSRRYYHGVQYTKKQIQVLEKRKQPVVTYNRIGRKIMAFNNFTMC